jgi:hypothetical protein
MRGEVLISEQKPGITAVAGNGVQGLPRIPCHAPAIDRIGDAAEGVHDCIQVGRDMQAVVGEVIRSVHHGRKLTGRQHLLQAMRHPGAAYPTRENNDHAVIPRRRSHASRSARR